MRPAPLLINHHVVAGEDRVIERDDFLSRGGELWGFEMVTPTAKRPFVRDLFGLWIDAIGRVEEH
ncbi:MAG TPA: hypothetical protein VMT87_06540 [Vicinamibacteria bacterium]|nr:hypothetical protein [Vicinamibacteria bacterium]